MRMHYEPDLCELRTVVGQEGEQRDSQGTHHRDDGGARRRPGRHDSGSSGRDRAGPPPHGLRARRGGVGRGVREPGDAIRVERLPGELHARPRLQLTRQRQLCRDTGPSRRVDRGDPGRDRCGPSGTSRSLARHRVDAVLSGEPHARRQDRALREHRRVAGRVTSRRRPDVGHLGSRKRVASDRRRDRTFGSSRRRTSRSRRRASRSARCTRSSTTARPATLDIVPQPSDQIEIAGRAVIFPANTGVTDATLDIYEVDPATGGRLGASLATYPLSGDGAWGPFAGDYGKSYELTISRTATSHHFYIQPLVRSDYLMRLNSSEPDQGIGALGRARRSPLRHRHQPLQGVLGQRGDSQRHARHRWHERHQRRHRPDLEARRSASSRSTPGSDGVSHVDTPIAALAALPFLTGMDLFIPAATPPDRTISVVNAPRGDTTQLQVVNVPNFASSTDAVSVVAQRLRPAPTFRHVHGSVHRRAVRRPRLVRQPVRLRVRRGADARRV